MSNSRGKLKCLIVLGGVALALMPCLQQTHSLCRLAGCIKPRLAERGDAVVVTGLDRERCCGHKSAAPREKPRQNSSDESPCGPDCWCCQPVDPREAPRNATESTNVRALTLQVEMPSIIRVECQPDRIDLETLAPDAIPKLSAAEACARLCRFLI